MGKSNRIPFLLIGSVGAVLFFLLVLYFSVPKLINSEIVKRQVSAYFHEKTRAKIAYQKSDIYLFPAPHIDFRRVSISIPGKADGLTQFVDVYPDLWSLLIKGNIQFSKMEVEAPRFSVAMSEEAEKTSLEQIEQKLKSIIRGLTSIAPDLFITVQDGKLNLTKNEQVVFSFDTIRTKLNASGKSLNISLTCASNMWGNLSFESLLRTEDLKSAGIIQIKDLRSHALLTELSRPHQPADVPLHHTILIVACIVSAAGHLSRIKGNPNRLDK